MEIAPQRYRKRKVAELKRHPRNPRRGDVRAIRESIKSNGFYGVVVVQKDTDHVLAGWHRYLAAVESEAKEVPTLELDVDDETAVRILLADNRTSDRAGYNTEDLYALLRDLGVQAQTLEGTGYGLDDFRALEREVANIHSPEAIEDEPPSRPKRARTKRGELVELGPHRLICGDATDPAVVDALLGDETPPLLFTSPPYLDAREYGGEQDLDVTKLASFLPAFARRCELIAVNLGLLFREGEVVRYWDDYIAAAHEARLKLLAWNVWNREDATNLAAQTVLTFPTWHEWVLVFGERQIPGFRTLPTKREGDKPIGQRQRDGSITGGTAHVHAHKRLGSVLTLPSHKGKSEGDHPAVFPVGLPSAYLASLTAPDEIVVDPFIGSGTTLVAAEQQGRRCYGIELDPGYCDVVRERYNAVRSQGNTCK